MTESSPRISQMIQVQNEGLELFKTKNTDYGDAFANYGPIGVIVRMGDKIQRLVSVTNHGINLVNTESIRDTLIDLHNYSAMAVMLIDEKEKEARVISQIEAESTRQVEKVIAAGLDTSQTIQKIMADGTDKFLKETGRTGITYNELRQMYG
jgi:hypothetical protein